MTETKETLRVAFSHNARGDSARTELVAGFGAVLALMDVMLLTRFERERDRAASPVRRIPCTVKRTLEYRRARAYYERDILSAMTSWGIGSTRFRRGCTRSFVRLRMLQMQH